MNHRPFIKFLKLSLVCCLNFLIGMTVTFSATTVNAQSDKMDAWLEFRDGSIIKAAVDRQIIPWLSVEKDGTITESEKNLDDLSELYLTNEPASEKIARIRRLIDQLAANDFRQRNLSEKTLVLEGGPFIELIQIAAKSNTEPEVQYRVERILKGLGESERENIELDYLKIGSKMIEGDVRDWKLTGNIGTTNFEFDRSHLRRVYFENPIAKSEYGKQGDSTISVQPFTSKGDEFYQAGQTHVSFDEDELGARPSRNTIVQNLFEFQGSRFACENPGWEVIVSGFSFLNSVSKTNSIGNHFQDPETGKHFRYMGVMEVTFCLPGRRDIPAAVGRAGCFLEIVVPRHTLMEAYNAAGNRIGMVEAATNRSSFVGFKSNEPIARLRIMPNYYLKMDEFPDDELNEDFAVDDLCFSDLVLINDLNMSDKHKLLFKSGESMLCEGFTFDGENINVTDKRFDEAGLTFDVSTLVSVMGPKRSPERTLEGALNVMLSDGSIVKATAVDENKFELDSFGEAPIKDVLGFWNGNVALYPESSDLENVAAVAVYPTCRFTARNFEIADGKFKISADAVERLQQNGDLKVGIPEPQVDEAAEGLSFGFDKAPSVWFKTPAIVSPDAGLLRLQDGQQFVLGGESGFKLKSTDGESITIAKGDNEQTFSTKDVAVFRFAK